MAQDTLWTCTFGGPFFDELSSVLPRADGSFVVSGFEATDPYIASDICIAIIDSLGNLQSRHYIDSETCEKHTYIDEIADGFILGAYGYSPGTPWKVYLMKTDTFGDIIWRKTVL